MAQEHEPTDEELSADVASLLAEVDGALTSSRWAVRQTGSDHTKHRLYAAAALRHCCLLLAEIEQSASAGSEVAIRLLARAHIEAWLTATYLHFGGIAALTRIGQDTLHGLLAADRAHKSFDQWLTREKKKARRRLKAVRRTNEEITRRNQGYPDLPAAPLLDEPHIPQLSPTGADLTEWIASFGDLAPQGLPVEQIAAALSKLGPEQGFGFESFMPMYLIYRLLSGMAAHPTLSVYEFYFTRDRYFTRTMPHPAGPSLAMQIRITSLYATAFLAARVLGDAEWPSPTANEIASRLEPDSDGGRPWTASS